MDLAEREQKETKRDKEEMDAVGEKKYIEKNKKRKREREKKYRSPIWCI
jgi:hypothetical protein